jgi:tetratricopeptide (TPR) repeat protein
MKRDSYIFFIILSIVCLGWHPLSGQQARDTGYEEIILRAEQYLEQGNYRQAKQEYENALRVNPDAAYPRLKLQQIREVYIDPDDAGRYSNYIAQADRFFNQQDYKRAREQYFFANIIKPGESHPVSRMKEIDGLLIELERRQGQYTKSIKTADSLYKAEDYRAALNEYLYASGLMPGETYPRQRIDQINKLFEEARRRQQLFEKTIEEADQLYMLQDYESALATYQQALKQRPGDRYTTGMIDRINAMGSEQRSLENVYVQVIENADRLFNEADYDASRAGYEHALRLKPDEEYPQQRIQDIENRLSELADLEENYLEAIEEALARFEKQEYKQAMAAFNTAKRIKALDENNTRIYNEIEDILEKEKNYRDALAEADDLFSKGSYQQAREKYTQVLNLKPEDTHPTERIAEIDSILADLGKLEENYLAAVSAGDDFFANRDYRQAVDSYQQATKLKPTENYPKERISAINPVIELLASGSQHYERKEYQQALAQYNQAKELLPLDDETLALISEIELLFARQQAFDEVKTQAGKLFDEAKYEDAKKKYEEALAIIPGDKTAGDRIAEIDALLIAMANRDQSYLDAITKADKAWDEKNYAEALGSYRQAGNIKPEETHPKQRIEKVQPVVDLLELAAKHDANQDYQTALEEYNKAKELLPLNDETLARISEIETLLANQQAFAALKTDADALFEAEDYHPAREKYASALEIMPDAGDVTARISEIDSILAAIAEKEQNYVNAISQADHAFENKDYQQALSAYQQAVSIKPEEAYPAERVDEVQKIIQEIEARQLAYSENVAMADARFSSKEYQQAIAAYQKALEFKPGDQYAQNRIAEARSLISEAEINEAYANAVSTARFHEDNNDLISALNSWESATNLKPDETLPKERIGELSAIVAAEKRRIQEAYDKAIADGNRHFNSKVFDQAIEAYTEAGKIKPDETYPAERIAAIRQYIEERAIVDLVVEPVSIGSGNEKRFNFEPVDMRVRRNNYVILTLRFTNTESSRFFLNYGLDGQRSGGIVVRNPGGKEQHEFIVRVSSQDRWYRIDNNWISIYPEGSDVEVLQLRISSGD